MTEQEIIRELAATGSVAVRDDSTQVALDVWQKSNQGFYSYTVYGMGFEGEIYEEYLTDPEAAVKLGLWEAIFKGLSLERCRLASPAEQMGLSPEAYARVFSGQ